LLFLVSLDYFRFIRKRCERLIDFSLIVAELL
jgi:hypothetical protein